MAEKKQKMEEKVKSKEERVKERAFFITKIRSIEKSLTQDKFGALNLIELKQKSERLSYLFQQFEACCLLLSHTDAEKTEQEDEEIDTLVEALKSKITHGIDALNVPPCSDNAQTTETSENTNQPEALVEIKNTWGIFDGRMHEWHGFSKRFKEAVHADDSLQADQKLDLLEKSCTQSAAEIVSEAGGSYELAWEKLNNMYGEAYGQIHHCMQKIAGYSRLQDASAHSLKRLRNFANIGVGILKQVMEMEKFEAIVTVILAEKLDAETARIWERHRMTLAESWANAKNGNASSNVSDGENSTGKASERVSPAMHILKWDDFSNFLQSEIEMCLKTEKRQSTPSTSGSPLMARRSVQGNSHNEQAAQTQSWAQSTEGAVGFTPPLTREACPICNGNHALHKCDVYKALPFPEKHRLVEGKNLCRRCLRKHHGPSPCENKTNNKKCPECDKWGGVAVYHNATLCPTRFSSEPPKSSEEPDWQQS